MYSFEDIKKVDPQIAQAITDEMERQNSHIELIASENWVSNAVMASMGSPLTNKYAEGYPAKRYYGGCEHVDEVENLAIERIDSCEAIAAYCKKKGLKWTENKDLIKNIYNDLQEQPFYKKYMESSARSFREDAEFAANIFLNILEQNELLEKVLEDESILWSDDLGYILTMAARTVSSMRESQEQIKLMPKFKSDEDLDFAKKLLRESIIHFADNRALIDSHTNNWDVERLALMDIVILGVAIAEAKNFASIPVKVTMNEYIDVAKYYSTPASSTFINGVLDKIIAQGVAEGWIFKTGKGLL